jgi:hypothetical protein
MNVGKSISPQTRNNWLIDTALFGSAILMSISGILSLSIPKGGFQRGHNLVATDYLWLSQRTLDSIHTWAGLTLIAVALVHLLIHRKWVVSSARRLVKEWRGQCECMNPRGRFNILLNVVVLVSFTLAAVSGLYLMFVHGGRSAIDSTLLLSRSSLNLIHTWTGMIWIVAAVVHFVIHWKWVNKVTRRMLQPANLPANACLQEA